MQTDADELATAVGTGLERLIRLMRSLTPAGGLSITAAATLASLERSGPCRLTSLAELEGVTQPAMTQVVARLQEAGLASRAADPDDGRVVLVSITSGGRTELTRRRAARGGRLAGMLAELSDEERAALKAALPVIETLTNMAPREREKEQHKK
jgi:DNA-binding MarR family transcriptional regulator